MIGAGSDHHGLSVDHSAREITVLVPLAIMCVVLGIQPWIAIDAMAGSVTEALAIYPEIVTEAVHQAQQQGASLFAGDVTP